MPTIALVDDDRNILTSVSIALESEGYNVKTYTDGASALAALTAAPPDLAVLDIKMPRMDGMEVLRRLRQKTDVPVIFLTSKDTEVDEELGLQMGADDFIAKPFSQRLLLARVRSVLRRASVTPPGAGKEEAAQVMVRGKLTLDPNRHACTWSGDPVTLTVTEFLILQALAQRPGYVKSRDNLMDAAYDDQVYVDDRTIDSHIKRLRKKFRQVDGDFDAIETLYGVGYRFKELTGATSPDGSDNPGADHQGLDPQGLDPQGSAPQSPGPETGAPHTEAPQGSEHQGAGGQDGATVNPAHRGPDIQG